MDNPTDYKFAQVDVQAEIEQVFDDSSLPGDENPVLLMIAGPIAAGKTTLRRRHYTHGYVVVDAAEIFLSLCNNRVFEFPPTVFRDELDIIGMNIAERAIRERRNIVTEVLLGEVISLLSDAMKFHNYQTEVVWVNCDLMEAKRRNERRGFDSISVYYTEQYHVRWLMQACRTV